MTQRAIKNNYGIWLKSLGSNVHSVTSTSTMNATGNQRVNVGRIFWLSGTGTKTVSTSGGKLIWLSISSTFANAGTTLRLGIQDIDATGVPDGTFDVYADLVGGTDTLGTTFNKTPFEVGTKDIAQGDVVALVYSMVSRAGSDTVTTAGVVPNFKNAGGCSFPYIYTNATRAVMTNTSIGIIGMIEADDGTIGLIENIPNLPSTSSFSFSSSSSPDEYAMVFKVPFKCTLSGAAISVGSVATTDTFEVVLYSDPEGTPSEIEAVVYNPIWIGASTVGDVHVSFANNHVLQKDTWYAISVKPTSVNSISVQYRDVGSGYSSLKQLSDFGSDIKLSGRTDETGAFVEIQDYYLPSFAIRISAFDDGLGRIKNIDGVPYASIS